MFYNDFSRPSVAPPDWLFAPMWLFLNITSLVALHKVANSPSRSARTAVLWSEGVAWVLFATFTTVYFQLRSPILGAVDTVLGLVLAVVSVLFASRLLEANGRVTLGATERWPVPGARKGSPLVRALSRQHSR